MSSFSDEVSLRFGTQQDMPAVLELIKELAAYEHASQEVKNSAEQLISEGFGLNPAFECVVASLGNQIIGFALFFTSYSTWKGKCLYLEDLYVREEYRRLGIGKELFDFVLQLAKNRKMKRLSWQVLEWNTPAISFYKKYNSVLDPEWINGKIVLED
jgi:GNAT superfamily N-acetyltransferase